MADGSSAAATGLPATRAPGSAAARSPDPNPGSPAAGTAPFPDAPAQPRLRVRDRDVVLLAAFCVAVVLGLQLLGIVFPPVQDAIGRPPTMIVALIVVTLVVLARALWTSVRRP